MESTKYQVLALALIFVVSAFTGCVDEEDDKTTVKIGFMNPITGPLEPDAPGFTWGANEAISDLNKAYPDYNFELVEVDSGCDGTPAAAGAQTLVDSGVVAVAGAACSGASMGANAVLSAAGTPMISYASTNPGLSNATAYPLFYRVVPSDAIQGPAGVDMMVDAGVTSGSLAILHMTNDYGSGLADSIKSAWENKTSDGQTLCGAGMQGYVDTTTDFSALAESISGDADCTAVYLSSYIQDAAGIIEALKDDGWDGKIFAGDGPAGVGLYEKMGDNAEATGVTVSAPRAGSTYGDFEARYDANAADVGSIKTYVLTTYDAVTMIGEAAQMSGAINDNIKTVGTGFEGSSGKLTFLDNGDVGGAGYDICTYSGDTADANGGYSCSKYWTATGGVQSA